MVWAVAGQNEHVPERAAKPERESAELVGELARELSALVRRDIEVAATERLPTLRRAFLDVAVIVAVAVAGLFALAWLSVAGGRLAATSMPAWGAALVIAGVWGLVSLGIAAVLLRPRAQPSEREQLFGLLQLLARTNRLEVLQSGREEARDEAEHEMRQTSEALVETVLDEAAEHQLKALPEVAKRELEKGDVHPTETLTKMIALLAIPARAGWEVLGRLVEPGSVAGGRQPNRDQRSEHKP
jgi:Putative Actinobacterial Holin-X, holin superfamily III